MELVDGYYGRSHITADQMGDLNMGIFGAGSYVFQTVGNALSHEIVTNNKVLIKDGAFVHQGRRGMIRVGMTETAIIENGTQSMKRNDLICIRYQKNMTTAIESFTTVVIKGTPGTTAVDPIPVTGIIRSGAVISDFPIKRVQINGLSIEGIDDLFDTVHPVSAEKDYIVESGKNTNGFYEKWNSGKLVMWGKTTIQTPQALNAAGAIFCAPAIFNLPVISLTPVIANINAPNNFGAWVELSSGANFLSAIGLYAYRVVAGGFSVEVHFQAKGTWK